MEQVMKMLSGLFFVMLMIGYVAVIIYLIVLFTRFVRAIERIAGKIESSSKI